MEIDKLTEILKAVEEIFNEATGDFDRDILISGCENALGLLRQLSPETSRFFATETGTFKFSVIDKRTGQVANEWRIAMDEDWADNLMWADLDGFAIQEDGAFVLLDECGNFAYCPPDRFEMKAIK